MKKVTFLLVSLLFLAKLFGQQPTVAPVPTPNTDYLQKSKNQKKTAWILLGGGAALMATGIIIPKGESKGFTGSYYGLPAEEFENDGIKAAFGITGLLSMIGSVPFFIASGKNKRKAASISLNYQRVRQIQNSDLVNKSLPSLTLKFNL